MNGFLLDTHVWLWARAGSPKLGPRTRSLLQDNANPVFLSAVTTWEITIKWGLGKLKLPQRPASLVRDSLASNQLLPLAITHEHAWRVGDLPPLHHDPFDRLLIAQALAENLDLITANPQVRAYPLNTRWAPD